jgi:predicted dehydrogenase
MSEPLKIGVVGGGGIAQVAHLPVLSKIKGVEVLGICDSDVPKARAIAQRFRVKDAFDDIEELLRFEQLDAVVICTPNHLHEAHILAAISAGVHVLVEKPLALTPASVQRVARAAERKKKIVMAGMNHRYRPDVQAVRSFVQTGELGEIQSVRGSWHLFRPSRAHLGWRTRRELSGGGAMLDLGLTMLDLAFWLAGNPTPRRVSAVLEGGGRDKAVEQSGSAFVVCDEELSIFFDVTWRHVGEGERFGMGVRGSRGTASINPLRVWKELHGTPTDVSPGSVSRENAFTASYRAEWAHFLAAIAGEAAAPSLDEHLTLHRTLDAIYRSAAEGKDVAL